MRVTEMLHADTVILDLEAVTKKGVINELADRLDHVGKLNDVEVFKKEIWQREKEGSTGIGDGVAIPHAKTDAVKTPVIVFGRSERGIDYESLDGKPSHLFFMIGVPYGTHNDYLDTLAGLASMLMSHDFREQLLQASDTEEILTLMNKEERKTLPKEEETVAVKQKVLAVTACPTGIAHTYMAADALKEEAQALGIDIKVETRGASGADHVLTREEIAEADGIIIAADTKVDMDRFHGKRLVEVSVTEAIRQPKKLFEKVLYEGLPLYQANGLPFDDEAESSFKRNPFYRHLMNGVSHMLPFVVGGGILIALSYFFGIEAYMPDSEKYNRFAEALHTIGGGSAFGLMIPVLAGFIAMSIADRPGLAPGMIGGFMAAQGESGFIGGLIAGFLAGYIVVGLKKLLRGLPRSLEGVKTVLFYPLLSIFFTGMIMFFVVEKPVALFNHVLSAWLEGMGAANTILLGLILGGMMAVDMGGPFNKVAYTFGIAMIADGILMPQAAIMAGGMVPPLGIALATTFFGNKFTKQERDAGKTNYIMGLSFITEGAIPFAATDPGRVIPSIITGSAVAGGLSMVFGIGLPAPHGGVFVLPLIEGSIWLYLLAILIGSVVTAMMLALLKKDIT